MLALCRIRRHVSSSQTRRRSRFSGGGRRRSVGRVGVGEPRADGTPAFFAVSTSHGARAAPRGQPGLCPERRRVSLRLRRARAPEDRRRRRPGESRVGASMPRSSAASFVDGAAGFRSTPSRCLSAPSCASRSRGRAVFGAAIDVAHLPRARARAVADRPLAAWRRRSTASTSSASAASVTRGKTTIRSSTRTGPASLTTTASSATSRPTRRPRSQRCARPRRRASARETRPRTGRPQLLVAGMPLPPLDAIVYYRRLTDAKLKPFPAGLKMVAGDSHAFTPQSLLVTYWDCGAVGETPRGNKIPDCGAQNLRLTVNFPDCWNGKRLDSIDHKRHMAYSRNGRCPPGHKVAVPAIQLVYRYAMPPVEKLQRRVPRLGQPLLGSRGLHQRVESGRADEARHVMSEPVPALRHRLGVSSTRIAAARGLRRSQSRGARPARPCARDPSRPGRHH